MLSLEDHFILVSFPMGLQRGFCFSVVFGFGTAGTQRRTTTGRNSDSERSSGWGKRT